MNLFHNLSDFASLLLQQQSQIRKAFILAYLFCEIVSLLFLSKFWIFKRLSTNYITQFTFLIAGIIFQTHNLSNAKFAFILSIVARTVFSNLETNLFWLINCKVILEHLPKLFPLHIGDQAMFSI